MTPILLVDCQNRLGESPLWDAQRKCLWWIDLLEPALHSFDPTTSKHHSLPIAAAAPLGMVAPTDQFGTLLLAHRHGISTLDTRTGTLAPLFDPEQGRDGIIYNDGKTDRQGHLWAGTSDLAETDPRGILHMRGDDGKWRIADSGLAVTNGPAFAPDNAVMYVSDSVGRRILAYDLGSDMRPRDRRIFAAMAVDEGFPDGLAVDGQGHLWCAHWDGWRVTRFTPEGKRDRVILIPVPRVTACVFGGNDLKTLYITTARDGLDPALLAAAPHSGSLFAIDLDVPGLVETPFALTSLIPSPLHGRP